MEIVRHGYLEQKYKNNKLWIRGNYFIDNAFGYFEIFDSNEIVIIKGHYINGKEIGCEHLHKSQYFYKTPDKKFGEQIIWE